MFANPIAARDNGNFGNCTWFDQAVTCQFLQGEGMSNCVWKNVVYRENLYSKNLFHQNDKSKAVRLLKCRFIKCRIITLSLYFKSHGPTKCQIVISLTKRRICKMILHSAYL